jgi:hypothetical protein
VAERLLLALREPLEFREPVPPLSKHLGGREHDLPVSAAVDFGAELRTEEFYLGAELFDLALPLGVVARGHIQLSAHGERRNLVSTRRLPA